MMFHILGIFLCFIALFGSVTGAFSGYPLACVGLIFTLLGNLISRED